LSPANLTAIPVRPKLEAPKPQAAPGAAADDGAVAAEQTTRRRASLNSDEISSSDTQRNQSRRTGCCFPAGIPVNLTSGFSSWRPKNNLALHPDAIAPRDDVRR